MGDVMLHGVLNMPLPDDPKDLGLVEWAQFKDRATQASIEITALQDKVARLEAALSAADDLAAIIDNFKYGEIPLELFSERQGYRNALRAIALDTTTATCDNTREGE